MPTGRVDFIDGLRALAIICVVGFHASIPFFQAGFLGVDIFLVISGYLIIGQIVRRIGDFSFLEFYAGRALRIVPPMVVVVVATLMASKFIGLAPFEMSPLVSSAAATLAFVPNIYFQFHSGYFDAPSEREPFLHMWSLGVEEQFYAVIPLLLVFFVALTRRRHQAPEIIILLCLVAVLSFAAYVGLSSLQSFYSMPARMWEFALGGALAVAQEKGWPQISDRYRTVSAGIGLLLMVTAVVATPTPSIRLERVLTIVPIVGCILLLASHPSPFHRLLATRPFVWVGLISYSWYLWHWPLFVLTRMYNLGKPDFASELIMQGLVGAFLGLLTYCALERPLRSLRHNSIIFKFYTKRYITSVLGACLCGVVLLLSYNAFLKHELEGADYDLLRVKLAAPKDCDGFEICVIGAGSKATVVWGDSLAWSLLPALLQDRNERVSRTILISRNSCPPVLSVDVYQFSRQGGAIPAECSKHNERAMSYIAAHEAEIEDVALIANWPEYGVGTGMSVAIDAVTREKEPWPDLLRDRLRDTVGRLDPLSVAIIGSVPTWRLPAPECLFQVKARGLDEAECGLSRLQFERRRLGAESVLRSVASELSNARYYDPARLFCNASWCSPVASGAVLYMDTTHLSALGASKVWALRSK